MVTAAGHILLHIQHPISEAVCAKSVGVCDAGCGRVLHHGRAADKVHRPSVLKTRNLALSLIRV